jgi:CheY-like chemotaxis protein/DNA-binding XRE family transcriptional regulator
MSVLDIKKEFGTVVRQHRLRLGISQETLAERANLHRTYITDIERGARNLSLESISKVARALEVSIGSLFSLPGNPPSHPVCGNQAEPAVHPIDLLLVEDDAKDVKLTLAAFQQAKLSNRVHRVRDGAEALDYLWRRGDHAHRRQEPLPELVLLDLNLPRVHGLEVLRQLKADERTRRIHVIVLTVSQRDDHIEKARALGADAYIVKPVDFQNFSAVTPLLDYRWTLLKPPLQQVP